MDGCFLFYPLCAQGNGSDARGPPPLPISHHTQTHTHPHMHTHPILGSIINEQADAAFYEVNN